MIQIEMLASLFKLNPQYKGHVLGNGILTVTLTGLLQEEIEYTVTVTEQGKVAMSVGENSDELLPSEAINRLCGLDRIRDHYKAAYERWKEREGGKAPYVVPRVGVAESFRAVNLCEYMLAVVTSDEDKYRNRMALLQGDYGQGKTSFCRYFANHLVNGDSRRESPFVFVFYLSENRMGAMSELIENQLATVYQLPMSYALFADLCEAGYFCAVLDAYDQLYAPHNRHHLEGDFKMLKRLVQGNGRMIVTARGSFFQRELLPLILREKEPLKVETAYLDGFDVSLAKDYVSDRGGNVLSVIEKDWPRLEKVLSKPLHLRLFREHYDLLDNSLEGLTAYDLFDVGYEKWVKGLGEQKDESILAVKTVMYVAMISGLNRKVNKERLDGFINKNGINLSSEKVFELLGNFPYVQIEEGDVFFSATAFLEYLWAKSVLYEIANYTDTISANERSFIQRYKLNPETLDLLYGRLKSSPDMALNLRELILCTRDNQYSSDGDAGDCTDPDGKSNTPYMGGNSLSLLCRLYAEEAYRKTLDELKQGKDSFQRLNLSGADLRFMDFRGCNFSDSVLDEADFSFAQLASAIFNTTWLHGIKYQEQGDIVACAFAGTDPLKVVACTETGGLLVYCLDDDSKTSVKAHTPFSVTEVRVRGQFVFTAGKDNNVICYDITNKIEERWRMPLQSTAQTLDTMDKALYVGTNTQGVIESSDGEKKIVVSSLPGTEEAVWITHLRAFINSVDETNLVIALANGDIATINTEKDKDKIPLPNIRDDRSVLKTGADITGMCVTETDILYVADGEALYGIPLSKLAEGQVQAQKYSKLDGAINIAYARGEKRVYCLRKRSEGYSIDACVASEESWGFNTVELTSLPKVINAFTVSDDGKYIALAGDDLTLAERDSDRIYEMKAPVKIKMDCAGMMLTNCRGLSALAKDFFVGKGARIIYNSMENDDK